MPQAVWTGDLSFGLVNIPVKLYAATSPKRVRFNQYEAGTGRRIRYRRMAEGPISADARPASSEAESARTDSEQISEDLPSAVEPSEAADDSLQDSEVPWDEIVKGYEVEPGRIVTVDQEELESVAPKPSRTIDVERFVDLHEIEPVYFEKSYYLVPQRGQGTERPYWLLYRTVQDARKVAIGRFVMRTKEYLVAVRPGEHVLMLETLFYEDEVRDPKELWIPSIEEPSERELEVARQLVETLVGEWDPARTRDEHRERLLALIYEKLDEAIEQPEPAAEDQTATVSDLMEALLNSVDVAKRAREEEARETG
jgi:DNA end-binding protein Ku